MKLTTKGRYAVTAMLDLALHNNGNPVSLAEISGRQSISLSYLEQLFSKLRKNKLVVSMRGPGGGYRLGREPESVSISDIISAVDENIDATRCGGAANCEGDNKRCLTHDLWMDLSKQIQTFLSNISLEDMKKKGDILAISGLTDCNTDKLIIKQSL
ncbi:MAG: Rrf2 family transcriptional regulator [Thiotrichaceae bacterium]|nr:Rrf2 family transcriptional regulator [Thiotrichaceae bacterium]